MPTVTNLGTCVCCPGPTTCDTCHALIPNTIHATFSGTACDCLSNGVPYTLYNPGGSIWYYTEATCGGGYWNGGLAGEPGLSITFFCFAPFLFLTVEWRRNDGVSATTNSVTWAFSIGGGNVCSPLHLSGVNPTYAGGLTQPCVFSGPSYSATVTL